MKQNKQHVQHVGTHYKKDNSTELKAYVTGFVDGEGCFSVSFNKRAKLTTGIEVRPSFSISQNKRSLAVLKLIHTYFGCGAIRFSKSDQTYKYEVRSIDDLIKKVIPHFEEFPLLTSKNDDFLKFKDICDQVSRSHHLNKDNLKVIIASAYSMNPAGKRKHSQDTLLKSISELKK